jgi:hypothetical protein
MTKYEVIIYWSDEDQVFVAEVPEIPVAPRTVLRRKPRWRARRKRFINGFWR